MSKRLILKKLLLVPPIIAGILVVSLIIIMRQPPQQRPKQEHAQPVRVITVTPLTVIPRAQGYGTVQPSKVWKMVPEVSGRIVFVDSRLKEGEFVTSGTPLIRIDPRLYQLAVASAEANIANIHAQIEELQNQEHNYRLSLTIERRALELQDREVQRQVELLRKGTEAQASLDRAQQNQLGKKAAVQSLENSLSLIPYKRKIFQAQLDLYQVKLQEAQLDIQHTAIQAPFDCRIEQVNIEKAQFVAKGQDLAIAYGTDAVEIAAQFPANKLRNLIEPSNKPVLLTSSTKVADILGLKAVVRLKLADYQIEWQARVRTLSPTIDMKTRTIGVIVVVDDPYQKARPGIRPPLTKGMFCHVELQGKQRKDMLVIPRTAWHQGHVYLVDKDKRLHRRPSKLFFAQNNFLVIKSGLKPGDILVVSDVIPAIEGMALAPISDEKMAALLRRQVVVKEQN